MLCEKWDKCKFINYHLNTRTCDKCDNYSNFKSREDKKMDIKINYKAPMTEEEQRNILSKLFDEAYDGGAKTRKEWVGTENLTRKAMEICKNVPQVIDYISIDVSNITFAVWNGIREIRLTPDQIREIKVIKL